MNPNIEISRRIDERNFVYTYNNKGAIQKIKISDFLRFRNLQDVAPVGSNPDGFVTVKTGGGGMTYIPYSEVVLWDRTGTWLTTHTYGDNVQLYGSFKLGLGSAVNYIENTLTDNAARLPTSAAVFASIPSVSPAALTRTNDTNVTLTLGGTPATALLKAVSLTMGWSGTLADGRITSAATWNAKQAGHANLTSLSGLTYASLSFVKMSAAGTFTLDTNTYSQTGHAHAWSDITSGKPTTLAGYGISDTKANFNTALSDGAFMFTGDAPTSHALLSHTISGETLGHVLAADSATTYSIRQLLGSQINNDVGWTTNVGDVTAGTQAATQVAYWNATAKQIEGSANLIFDGTNLQIGNYTSDQTLTLACVDNGNNRINFYDAANNQGCYIRTVGETYGAKIYIGQKWTGDTDRIIIDTINGRLGINCTPSTNLHILDGSPILAIQTNSAGTIASPLSRKLQWRNYLNDEAGYINVIDQSSDTHRTDMLFGVRDAGGTMNERMRIQYDGVIDLGRLVTTTTGANIIGSGSGDTNQAYIGFYDSNGTTRRGYVGDVSTLNSDIFLHADTGALHLRSYSSYVDLFYNNVKKFETTSTGVTITGGLTVTAVAAWTSAYGYGLYINSAGNLAGTSNSSGGSGTVFLAGDGTWKTVSGTANNPGGGDTMVQYNAVGAFAGDSDFTWDYTDQELYVNGTVLATATMTATNYILSSDRRLKNVHYTINDGLEKTMKLNPVVYTWKDRRDSYFHSGFIAQEVQKFFPELVVEGKDGFLGLSYGRMSVLAIAGVQGLNTKVDTIENQLRKEIVDLEMRVKELENGSST